MTSIHPDPAAAKAALLDSARPPLVVAEMSGNHNQSLDKALAMVDSAAEAGAWAVKLQTYTADTLTLDSEEPDFLIDDPASPWHGRRLHELYEEAHTPWDWHQAIFERCARLGLVCFSTPFDETAVDFLEGLNSPVYKIASFEIVHHALLKKVARTGKPILVSTGMSAVREIDEAVSTIRSQSDSPIILLKCTSSYPASPDDINLRTIPHMREMFDCPVGLSDHTLGTGVAVAAVALGATLIEKHFTLSRAEGGVDSSFSIEPPELRSLAKDTVEAWAALGRVRYGLTGEEKRSLGFRRSLYVAQDMERGDRFTEENLRVVRPGYGLEPRYYELILGTTISRGAKKGTPVSWDLLL